MFRSQKQNDKKIEEISQSTMHLNKLSPRSNASSHLVKYGNDTVETMADHKLKVGNALDASFKSTNSAHRHEMGSVSRQELAEAARDNSATRRMATVGIPV